MYFSISTRASPNADFPSRCADFERGVERLGRVDAAHAASAAAGDRLDQHGVADLFGFAPEERRALFLAVISGHDGRARLHHRGFGGALQAHRAHRRRRRPDEHDASRGALLGELGVLAEEAVAGMQTFGAGALGRREDRFRVEITCGALADLDRDVGFAGEQRAAISGRVQRDRAQSEPPRGAEDPASDFAAVGDDDIGEHQRS